MKINVKVHKNDENTRKILKISFFSFGFCPLKIKITLFPDGFCLNSQCVALVLSIQSQLFVSNQLERIIFIFGTTLKGVHFNGNVPFPFDKIK